MAGADKKRMMARRDFKVLHKMVETLKDKRKEYTKFLDELCNDNAEQDWWPDRLRPALGCVLIETDIPTDVMAKISKLAPEIVSLLGTYQRRVRIPRETLADIFKREDELEELDRKLTKKVIAVAASAAVPTISLNLNTGEIVDKDVDEANPAQAEEDQAEDDGTQ